MFYVQCFGVETATCTCSVQVKSHDDVFVVNRCYGKNDPRTKPTMYGNELLTENFKIFKSDGGRYYRVSIKA